MIFFNVSPENVSFAVVVEGVLNHGDKITGFYSSGKSFLLFFRE